MEGVSPRGRPKKAWREIAWEEHYWTWQWNEGAVDHSEWRKFINNTGQWPLFFWYWLTWVVVDRGPL